MIISHSPSPPNVIFPDKCQICDILILFQLNNTDDDETDNFKAHKERKSHEANLDKKVDNKKVGVKDK